jgi:hypothetical protein
MKVIMIENVPTETSYTWQVAGKDSVSCYDTGCTGYYIPPDSGTASVQGAVLKLLLPDSRIVIAECIAKPDVAQNVANSLAGPPASTAYRDCRMPEANSTVEAEFNGNNVKLFMRAPSIDGTGRVSTETYQIRGVLQPSLSSEVVNQVMNDPDLRRQIQANIQDSTHSPAAAADSSLGPDLSFDELAGLAKTGQASACFILTDPAGAEIDIDGKRFGKSPIGFYLVRHGDAIRVVTIKMDGYVTIERRVLPDGKDIPLGLKLEPVSPQQSKP